jgi:hypothetical protein
LSDSRRQQRREIRLIQREATWLQKALFALGKATESREKLEGNGEDASYVLEVESGPLAMEALEDGLEARVKELLELVRERRKVLR